MFLVFACFSRQRVETVKKEIVTRLPVECVWYITGMNRITNTTTQHEGMNIKRIETYKTARHPKSHKWYIIGHCGDGYWMPVSDAFDNKVDAETSKARQYAADKDCTRALREI